MSCASDHVVEFVRRPPVVSSRACAVLQAGLFCDDTFRKTQVRDPLFFSSGRFLLRMRAR